MAAPRTTTTATDGKPSKCPTTQHPSSRFVESCGRILFHLSTSQICLIRRLTSQSNSNKTTDQEDEYLLPKGRRNIHESRHSCAIREAYEETGYTAKLLPIDLLSRATDPGFDRKEENGGEEEKDEARLWRRVEETFMLTTRQLPDAEGVKLIWQFVGRIDESVEKGRGEEGFCAEVFGFEEAVGKVTFQEDREVLLEAVRLVRGTYGL
ncbi:Putative NUDIX hydrolase domain-containing protein [Septoria linicola]|uniref:NUDIX hydrolase domain-containing protein n=1 Tax=Septoria linicola TaxID=215465 RepID=A0A9Q9ELG0_9PEZI|nr:Putative NUDIX hydrolase domain-containing protein [Septoria linicola]